GGLTGLPWAALPGDKPGTILLDDFALAGVPHGPFLLDTLGSVSLPPPKEKARVLVVGAVAYDDLPARAPFTQATIDTNRSEPVVKPGEKLFWQSLPGTEAEARLVDMRADRSRVASTRLLTCADAT